MKRHQGFMLFAVLAWAAVHVGPGAAALPGAAAQVPGSSAAQAAPAAAAAVSGPSVAQAAAAAAAAAAPPSPSEHPAEGSATGAQQDQAPLVFDLPDPKKTEPVENLFEKPAPADPDEPVITISEEALEAYVNFFPARSTHIGVGSYDQDLADYRKSSIAGFVGSCKGYIVRLDKVPLVGLTERGLIERDALRGLLRSLVWDLESAAWPARDPNFYVDESVGAIQALIEHDQAKSAKRAEHMLARMGLLPRFFSIARENLGECPARAVRRALMRLRGSWPLFKNTVATELRRSGLPGANAQADEATAAAWKHVSAFADWLEKERLPRAPAAAPLGEKGWRGWLSSIEDTDLAPPAILEAAEADMAHLKAELRAEAARVSREKPVASVLAEISTSVLEPDSARQSAERSIQQVWDWMVRKNMVEVPPDPLIEVREAPAFRRRDTPIRTELPGGYGSRAATSYLEIAPPDPDWPPPRLSSWLSSYGKYSVQLAVMRELYPGRFLAWTKMRQSRVRTCRSASFPALEEGWPLYAEELVVRDGFMADEPRLKTAMLADLIRADARLVVSIRLHTMGMSRDGAAAWLEREGFWTGDEARSEADRLLADPEASVPALGRLAILALREDYREKTGASFSPRDFHERLLSLGSAPLSAVRKIMLPGDRRPLVRPPK